MQFNKIYNDPIYGFLRFPHKILYEVIDHPYFQRLRRISQMGLSSLVYPGATHTRFHHALGALHLMVRAVETLRAKGVDITEEESEAVCLAILCHDIGHGPFSHTLERKIIPIHHEEISKWVIQNLSDQFSGKLQIALEIFENTYHKRFLHQLVSSQLDMDRLDYLSRDSFYSGVAEGVVGYDRILQMLHVIENDLVIEEKGIYSVEKFLMARRTMYWQVYLHKTSVAAERMLAAMVERTQELIFKGCFATEGAPKNLIQLLSDGSVDFSKERLELFLSLDDADIYQLIKVNQHSEDRILRLLANGLMERKLFAVEVSDTPIDLKRREQILDQISSKLDCSPAEYHYLFFELCETNHAYHADREGISILMKNGTVMPFSLVSGFFGELSETTKHFTCYPKFLR